MPPASPDGNPVEVREPHRENPSLTDPSGLIKQPQVGIDKRFSASQMRSPGDCRVLHRGYRDRVRIATWNVNSLRSRIDRVEALLDRHEIDVLALQETKAREDQLPLMGLQARGYDVVAAGVNQWNGVALISRVGLEDVEVGFPDMPGWGDPVAPEARAIGATCGGVRIWSLYIPNGRKPDDPHYVYKLDWLARLREAAHAGRARRPPLSATGTSVPPTTTCSTSTSSRTRPMSRRGARCLPGPPRRRLGGGHPCPRARLHLLGLLPAAVRA